MTTQPVPEKWERWQSGEWRLHLYNGGTLRFTGRLRFKANATIRTDLEIISETIELPPKLSDLVAVEKLHI